MNYITEKLLESFDDFAVEELDGELITLNIKIDNKIKKGVDYSKEAKEHLKVVRLREQIMTGI